MFGIEWLLNRINIEVGHAVVNRILERSESIIVDDIFD
jgi:hypothetical protein